MTPVRSDDPKCGPVALVKKGRIIDLGQSSMMHIVINANGPR